MRVSTPPKELDTRRLCQRCLGALELPWGCEKDVSDTIVRHTVKSAESVIGFALHRFAKDSIEAINVLL